jgi:predicted dehydrogenase
LNACSNDSKRINSVLRGAIIGFGAVAANGHWPAYAESKEAEIVAVVDRTAARRDAARKSIGAGSTFATIEELADGAEIDFVDICTPPALHGELILKTLARGWDVLCEKPLVLDVIELDGIRRAMRESNRVVIPVHNWKYAPIIRRATEVLRSGTIGELREVQIETLRIEDCAAIDPENPNWRRDPTLAGGGILMDHGWHALYLARHWFGHDPVEIDAHVHRATPGGIEDEASLTLHFPNGQAAIFLTWRAETRRNIMRLTGDRGAIVIEDETLITPDGQRAFESPLSVGSHHADWFGAMLPDVLASFKAPAKSDALFEEAAFCLSMIRRAYEIADVV